MAFIRKSFIGVMLLVCGTATVLAETITSSEGNINSTGWQIGYEADFTDTELSVISEAGNTLETDATAGILLSASLRGNCDYTNGDCSSATGAVSFGMDYTYSFSVTSDVSNTVDIDIDYLLANNLSISTTFTNSTCYYVDEFNTNYCPGSVFGMSSSLFMLSDTYDSDLDVRYGDAIFASELYIDNQTGGSLVDKTQSAVRDSNESFTINTNTDYFISLTSFAHYSYVIFDREDTAQVSLYSYADPTVAITSANSGDYLLNFKMANQVFTETIIPVPEASSLYLLAFGLLGLFGVARRKV